MTMNWAQVPADDHDSLKAVVEEMATISFPRVQWGDHGVVLSSKGSYRTAFFEAFGDKEGFIRGEGRTVLAAAQQALEAMKNQAACTHDSWRYTHNNGHKTCGNCGYFTACTPEEAIAHYEHGEVELPDKSTYLIFDTRRPLCPTCGGHALIHDYTFDIHRCNCGQRLETVKDDDGYPALDGDHNPVLRPIDSEPQAVGFWNAKKGLWLGEDGHIHTYRLSEVERWRWTIGRELRNKDLELRLVNADLTPGEAVPFSFDEEGEVASLRASLDHMVKALAFSDDDTPQGSEA